MITIELNTNRNDVIILFDRIGAINIISMLSDLIKEDTPEHEHILSSEGFCEKKFADDEDYINAKSLTVRYVGEDD